MVATEAEVGEMVVSVVKGERDADMGKFVGLMVLWLDR